MTGIYSKGFKGLHKLKTLLKLLPGLGLLFNDSSLYLVVFLLAHLNPVTTGHNTMAVLNVQKGECATQYANRTSYSTPNLMIVKGSNDLGPKPYKNQGYGRKPVSNNWSLCGMASWNQGFDPAYKLMNEFDDTGGLQRTRI